MAELLVDSDVLIDHLRTGRGMRGLGQDLWYSVVTSAELFAGREGDGEIVGDLLSGLRELTVTRAIAERAGRIRRTSDLALPDALIAATALEHGLTLLTHNRRHFDPIPGLPLRSPA